MKKTLTSNLILCALPAIGILCSGCQEKSGDGAAESGADNTAEQTVTADLSDNLDLTVVVALFGESENLEDFEKKLNEPERQISNLDLNEDGEVDYLRVVESSMDETHLVSVQAVLGEDQYQDVATFDVEKDPQGQVQVQVVGDPYVYGPNYVVRPTYQQPPLITALFWAAAYQAWRSPYSYGRYPSYYRPWSPYPPYQYRDRVSHYRYPDVSYGYWSGGKRSKNSVALYGKTRRNDYGSKHARKSFDKRNKGVANRYELTEKRGKTKVKGADKKRPVAGQKPGGKPVTLPATKPGGMPSTKPAPGKPTQPAAKQPMPAGKPSQPAAKQPKPAAKQPKPAGKPSQPAAKQPKPAGKPSQPAAKQPKPAGKPAAKPSGKSGGKK